MLDFITFQEISTFEKLVHCIDLFKHYLRVIHKFEYWDLVIGSLDKIHEYKYLDDWGYFIVEILPASILEVENYVEQFDYINEKQFEEFKELYKNSTNQNINVFLELIQEISSIEMYSNSKLVSEESYEIYKKILLLINKVD